MSLYGSDSEHTRARLNTDREGICMCCGSASYDKKYQRNLRGRPWVDRESPITLHADRSVASSLGWSVLSTVGLIRHQIFAH